MLVEIDIGIADPIYFKQSDLSTEHEGLRLSLDQDKYHVTIHPFDLSSDYLPGGLIGSGLTIRIEIPNPDQNVVEALKAEELTESVIQFQREIMDIVLRVYRGFEDYVRNVAKQFWIEPLFDGRPVDMNDIMTGGIYGRGARWIDSEGNWRYFLTTSPPAEPLYNTVGDSFGLDRGKAKLIDNKIWSELARFIEAGKPAPMRDVLIANSLYYLEIGNGRLAVVDAVIALEAEIRQRVPKVLARLPGASQLNTEYLDRLIEKMGLRAFVTIGFGTVKDLVGLDPKDIEIIGQAIEARNAIIHTAKKEIPLKQARKYVQAINRVIDAFETWL